jgi:hypothetical protein
MIKLIRNNQKKFIAGTGVVLMITFVAGYGGPKSGRDGPTDHEIGRADGKAVMATEVGVAHADLVAVNTYVRKIRTGVPASLLEAVLGPDVAANMMRRPELFVLLRREALAAGVVPNPGLAQQYMDEYLGGTNADGSTVDPPSTDSDAYAQVRQGITDVLTVANHYDRVIAALKPSRPAVDREMATSDQSILLTLVPVPTDKFEKAVPTPTGTQLAAQFGKFADTSPGRPDPVTNPFGFGYRVPTLVNLQYVRITREAVEKAVIATQSDYDWEVAARKLYHAHPEQFAVAPPTTRATDTPGPSITPPFEKVRDDALKSLRSPLVQSLQDRVQQFVSTTLANDFAAYQSAVTAATPVPVSSVGKTYNDPAYMQALVDHVNAQFHVALTAEQTGDVSNEQLQKLPHLGAAQSTLSSGTSTDGSLPGYVADRAVSYLDPKSPAFTADLLKPSPPFTDEDGVSVDFVRMTSVKGSHPAPTLASVQAAVQADVVTAAAYDLAKAEADALVTAAATGKLGFSAAAAGLYPISSQPLSMSDVTVDGLKPPLGDAAHDFLTQAFGLLDTFDPVKNPHPTKVVALPAQHRLIVAQLTYANVRWTASDYAEARLSAVATLQRQQATAARLGWFSPDAIVDRTAYKPATPPSGS